MELDNAFDMKHNKANKSNSYLFKMCAFEFCHQPHKNRVDDGVGIFIKQGIKYRAFEKLKSLLKTSLNAFQCVVNK